MTDLPWSASNRPLKWIAARLSILSSNFHPVVNFTNILLVPFLYKRALHSFSMITVWLYNFWQKNIGAKAARKMLMKLTIVVNFT